MKTVEWHETESGPQVWLVDQLLLPHAEIVVRCADYMQVAEAIRTMQVRGAPAIGVTAAMGVAIGAVYGPTEAGAFATHLDVVCDVLARTRPTAVNLFWGIARLRQLAEAGVAAGLAVPEIKAALVAEAQAVAAEDEAGSRRIGEHGAVLFAAGDGVLTHCNAGALACVDYGTALAPLRFAHQEGKRLHVFVDETRPFLQGSRLTAWELQQAGIDCTLITDNMAAYFMGQGAVQKVIVGADRIAANGDVANKIGTYGLAILAAAHDIPFYVAAPLSTIDMKMASGANIPIEERDPAEVTHFRGQPVAPAGVRAAHPAFDVTPSHYITALITDRGLVYPPYVENLRTLVGASVEAPARGAAA